MEESKSSKSTCLLKGDIKELLNMIPVGSRLNCNLDRLPAKDRAHHPVALIKSRNGFVNSRSGKLFPFKAVIRDVENRVIQLSAVLEKAEQNPNFNLQIDHESGKLFAYDGCLRIFKSGVSMSNCGRILCTYLETPYRRFW